MQTTDQLYSEAEKLRDGGDLEGAANKLTELLAQDARFALAHSALAVIFGRMGRHAEAVEHAMKVCELEPNDPFSFTALSVTCQRAGRITEAEDAMARARMMHGQR